MKKQGVLIFLMIAMALTAAAAQADALVAYFSMPEDVVLDGVDAIGGASVLEKNGVHFGNLEYVAKLIAEKTGSDLWRIETEQQYPLEHDALLDFAADEQDREARPSLAGRIENPDQYDRIFLGFPNWWYDLPMPLYAFLESYDFSGKEIIPFVVHGGSGFSDTVETIAALQPDADIFRDGLSITHFPFPVAGSVSDIPSLCEVLRFVDALFSSAVLFSSYWRDSDT